MNEHKRRRLDEVEAEVAQLRRELAELRDGLADEVRTRRVLVADDEDGPRISLSVSEHDPDNPQWGWATLSLSLDDGERAFIELTVTSELVEPYAFVTVNGVELPMPQPA